MRSVKRRMRLPDMEIAALFCDEIVGRFTWVAGRENGLDRFCDALVGGGAGRAELGWASSFAPGSSDSCVCLPLVR